jgi:hypothetical protein
MLHLFQVLNYFILIKLCLGNLRERFIGRSEPVASFTTSDTHTLWSIYGFLFAICKCSFIFSPYTRCGSWDILQCRDLSGHPCPVRFNIRQSFLPRVSEGGGGFQVVMRNLRMRRLHCATSVAPCCALVSAALALYRWLRIHRQVYRFILDFFSLFFPVPFSTSTASETSPPPPHVTDVHKSSCTLPRGRLANF